VALCGNRHKVAAYRRRLRDRADVRDDHAGRNAMRRT
jgi:hypothetical protein